MARVGSEGSGATPQSRGAARGSMHGRTRGAAAAVDLAELFPSKAMPGSGKAHKGHKGRTKHGKVGMHGRSRSPLSAQARKDPWKHKDQAAGQG